MFSSIISNKSLASKLDLGLFDCIASSNICKQNGHETATVSAPVSIDSLPLT